MTYLLIGAVVWAYLGILFEFLMETVAWERWEGTIEYTFMAPLSRAMHLAGQGVFAILYGLVRAVFLFGVCALFFDLSMPDANFFAAFVILAISSISFIGIGMMTSVLPLISPEKGTQLGLHRPGNVARRLRRLLPGRASCPSGCSGSRSSRRRRTRSRAFARAILDGDGARRRCGDEIWPLLVIGAVSIPLGLWVFRAGRDVREAAREAEAERLMTRRTSSYVDGLLKVFDVPEREAGSRRSRRRASCARKTREVSAVDEHLVRHRAGRGRRLPRPERRRQDDDAEDALRACSTRAAGRRACSATSRRSASARSSAGSRSSWATATSCSGTCRRSTRTSSTARSTGSRATQFARDARRADRAARHRRPRAQAGAAALARASG